MITRPEVVRKSLVNKVLREENTALRRQVEALRGALEYIAQVALDALGCDRVRADRLEAQRIIVGKRKQARAALAEALGQEEAET